MKDWMQEVGGDAVRPAERCMDELTDEETDRVNAYEARLQEITGLLATEAEVDALLLQAKIEVARRNTIASHLKVPADTDAEIGREGRLAPLRGGVERVVSALGDISSFWLLFVMTVVFISPHLNAANDAAKALLLAGAGLGFGAVFCKLLIRRHRSRAVAAWPTHDPWWGQRLESMADELKGRPPSRVMRAVDISFAVAALASMTVPLALGSLLLKFKGRRVLDRQPRVGQGGRVFVRYKFNVHVSEAGAPASHSDLFLIRSGIEQLPRLWNLLNGDLTLVGPKPENPALAIRYPQACRWVFEYRPGLTGPVSPELRTWLTFNKFGAETYLKQVVPLQSAYDRNYFALSTPTQFRVMARALLLLMVPLIVENRMLRDVDPHTLPEDQDPCPGDAAVPSMPASEQPSAAEQVGRVTKWSRHENDHAFA
ncbi:sugar transferase [Streptomyces sp. RS2]|uniref:sugar transferase n=1 Tax=Streptomyces sp. RS2 TaxID=1451205 RepID=UPI0021F8E809|nr:sugar transferase [Streptomyces sp. RS2]MCW1100091.1 sugar transferase [Streptomyces sp. RS2]